MKQTSMVLRLLSLLLCVVLIAAMALTTVGCDTDKNNGDATTTETGNQEKPEVPDSGAPESATDPAAESETTDPSAPIEKGTGATGSTAESATDPAAESETTDPSAPIEKGTGATTFTFVVTLADGATTTYTIHTDKKTVGAALLELELIAGEESTYGLYVKTVQGVTADYDTDKTYWAFYIDGEYAMTGVDQTDIKAGATYTFKIEKG